MSSISNRRTFFSRAKSPADTIWKAVRNEIAVVLIVLIFILTLKFVIILIWGWFGPPLQYPALQNINEGLYDRNNIADSDNDGLPNAIEDAPLNAPVYNQKNHVIGYGTATNSHKADTDGDGFPDGTENVMGTDPNNWINPGYIWIIWGATLIAIAYYLFFYKPDRLKEYIKNEMNISGVTGKYAYTKPANMENVENVVSPEAVESFREVLASDHFMVDNITALSQASRKKWQIERVAYTTGMIGIAFLIWASLLLLGNKINSRYDSVSLDNFFFAITLAIIGVTFVITAVKHLLQARRATSRSINY